MLAEVEVVVVAGAEHAKIAAPHAPVVKDRHVEEPLVVEHAQKEVCTEEAKQSVRLLEECQLIKKDASGKYVLTESAITTGDRTSKLALRGFHQHCLKLAADAIDRDPPGKRHISGLTLGISQEGVPNAIRPVPSGR